jgi:hypothetical protein
MFGPLIVDMEQTLFNYATHPRGDQSKTGCNVGKDAKVRVILQAYLQQNGAEGGSNSKKLA